MAECHWRVYRFGAELDDSIPYSKSN